MKLDKYKKWFLKIIFDFLIADYSSWKVLETFIFKRRKSRDRLKKWKMSLINILIVCFLSFIVSILSISVGGTSLITVPVLISLGMISKNAVATNMFALIFLSMSGAIGFRKETKVSHYKAITAKSVWNITYVKIWL